MAKPAHAKPKTFRRARLWVASVIALALGSLVATLVTQWSVGQALELMVSDMFRAFRALPDEQPPAEAVPITLILIDDGALARHGHWPWPWTRLADVVDSLAELGARPIVFDIEFPEPDPPRVVTVCGPDGRPQDQVVHTVPRFVESIRAAGNVLIPFSVYLKGRGETKPAAGAKAPAATSETAASLVPPVLARHAVDCTGPQGGLVEAEGFQPMIEPLAAACAGSGFTSYPRPDPGNVVRRVPMLARSGKVFPHLMLEAAAYWRFGPGYHTAIKNGRLTVSSSDASESIGVPLDRHGQLELRWPTGPAAQRAVSVSYLLELAEKHRRWRAADAELDAAFPSEGYAAAARALDNARARAAAPGSSAPAADAVKSLAERLAKIEERLAMNLAEYVSDPSRAPPAVREKLPAETAQRHLALLQDYASYAEALRSEFERRLCIIGVSATGVSGLDLHTTPVGSNQPGVTVYPAGIRTILSGVAFRRLDAGQEWLLAVLVAWLVGVLAVRLPTAWGIVAAVWISAGVLVAARFAVGQAAVLLPVAGPLLAIVAAFAGVSGYRQLTEASYRRWITRAFGQYTSAEIVEEIQRHPERLRLGGERRDITFLFSDIAGFTPLSEKLEPETLVALLNHYLLSMTGILIQERAMIDKYEGDAILAFFGAPVPVADHALRAVRAALAMQAALPTINDDLIRMGLLPPGTTLAMRIGCASGHAIVGNIGSERKLNYTAMGDTVNLGARLEEANRWLASRILVPEATRASCGSAVLFRRFGPARIRGKAQPVTLYEPLALEPAPPNLRAVADHFGGAIDALARGEMPAAEAALGDLLAIAPEDGPAQVLKQRMEAIRAGQMGVDEPWNLARPK